MNNKPFQQNNYRTQAMDNTLKKFQSRQSLYIIESAWNQNQV